jgi:hypothetical protein
MARARFFRLAEASISTSTAMLLAHELRHAELAYVDRTRGAWPTTMK